MTRMSSMLARACALLAAALLGFVPSAAAQSLSRWHLAEGATGSFFEEEILIGNPNATAADIRITYLRADGAVVAPQVFQMPATSRATVRVNAWPGVESTAVSAIVECTNALPIVVERSMYWPNGQRRGGHNASGVAAAAPTWYLAEGATGFFDDFILISNPDTTRTARVTATYLTTSGATITAAYDVAPASRFTIWPNVMVPGLENAAFSTTLRSDVGVIVERAMYWGANWEGGHGSVGVTAPALAWRFAEGFTGTGFNNTLAFDTFLLIANPDLSQSARVRVTFLRDSGTPLIREYDVARTSRMNVWANAIPELGAAAFSMLVESTNGVPIVAERAVYWGPPGTGAAGWVEGHNSPGSTTEAAGWAFADGLEDAVGGVGYDTYFLIANASATVLPVRATFVREDGTGIVRAFDVAAQSRFTIATAAFPELSNQRFATFIEAADGSRPFVAERAVYWGQGYYGGHGSAGVPWASGVAAPPSPPGATVTGISPASGSTAGGTSVTISGTNFAQGAQVAFDGVQATNVVVTGATAITATTPAHAAGRADVVVTSGGRTATLSQAFTYLTPAPSVIVTLADNTLAFGDSITQGITSQLTSLGTISLPAAVQTAGYPERLQSRLRARYPLQTIVVENRGVAGEYAVNQGQFRLPGLIQPAHDLVIILEGVNDINAGTPVRDIATALLNMVTAAKNAGKRVILSTLTPARDRDNGIPASDPAAIVDLNARIRAIARDQAVVLADMYAAFVSGDVNVLISPDGLHPTNAGYQKMADVFYDLIVAHFETTTTTSP